MHTDEIIDSIGGMGCYQVILITVLYGCRLPVVWGMMVMSFAGVEPDWWCLPNGYENLTQDSQSQPNGTYKNCEDVEKSSCVVVYQEHLNTVVDQWNLICDQSYIPRLMTSIQMAGVLIGCLSAGQMADSWGRKKPYYMCVLLHTITNLIAVFSVNWQMFIVMRFCIGFSIGLFLVSDFPYVLEFMGTKWRPICSGIPIGAVSLCLMCLAYWRIPDWRTIHIIIAAGTAPFLLGWFPESLRWLTVHNRVDEAEEVVDIICRYNKSEKPADTRHILQSVADEEQKRRQMKRYTYLDIYRQPSLRKKSIIIQFIWACASLVFYGITFGLGSLSGNMYFNLLLQTIGEIIPLGTLYFLIRKIGQRWTTVGYFALATLSAFSITVIAVYVNDENKGTIINVMTIICKLGVVGAWATIVLTSSEIYPTVVRNMGYGAANTFARVGGIIAPFVFAVKKGEVFIPFMVVGSLMLVCGLLVLLLEETSGRPLEDIMCTQESPKEPNDLDEKAKSQNCNPNEKTKY